MMNNSLAQASMSTLMTILFVKNKCGSDSLSLNRKCKYNDLLALTPAGESRSWTVGLRLFYLINSKAIYREKGKENSHDNFLLNTKDDKKKPIEELCDVNQIYPNASSLNGGSLVELS